MRAKQDAGTVAWALGDGKVSLMLGVMVSGFEEGRRGEEVKRRCYSGF